MKKVLVPSVRFKGFSEEWKEDTVRNIANITNGKLDANAMVKSGMYNFYTSGIDVYKIDKYSFEGEGISIAGNGVNMGYMHLVSGKYNAYQRTYILNNIKIDRHFLFYNLWKNFWEFCQKNTREGSIPYLLYNDISDFKIFKSHSNEQQKIAKLLDQISNLINLEEIKLNKLKQLKETLLQKMFPEGNSKTPRIRFKGFNEDWKEEKLEEIGQTYTGLSGKTKKDFGHGNSRYITYLNIFNNPIANLKWLDRIEEDCKQNSVKYGDIFVTTSSEIPEEVGITSIWPFKDKENIYIKFILFWIRLNNINNYYINFLAYNLRNNELRKDIVLLAQGISRFNISNRRFMKLNILLPNISEQQKIGDFFSKIDSLITLYHFKLNKLKQIKESLLQKMFV
ncbi:restriction endonuclease subunit S [Mycoplasmopsis felis]|uniref:restriction endonuclease subunit S n=1 Tax=Mycoplasmopsis felis TaxID=33923 RepID=UPI0021E0AAE1|nr:restriction endonuclease subunit S [Mycoplasmopsis felis]MCU9938608.1 restriction endonuclease subunit S [Mycoplasmopsis felis]